MNITDLEFFLVEIERPSGGAAVRSLLVRVATDQDIDGWGESRGDWRAGELAARRDVLLPTLAGRNISDIEELIRLDVLDAAPLRCAIEMACWDALGRIVGQPLCRIFGGQFRSRIPIAVRLPRGESDQVCMLARELAEQGVHTQIISTAGRPETDVETMSAVREAAGERAELRLDVACRYDVDAARELDASIKPENVQFVLDPLDTAEFEQVARLRRQMSLAVAVSAGLDGPKATLALTRSGAATHAVIDLEQVGGLAQARKCAAICEAAGLSASLGSRPALGVATAASTQLVAATPSFASANESVYPQLADDVLSEPLTLVDGMIVVPESAGLGVEVDRAKIERYQVS